MSAHNCRYHDFSTPESLILGHFYTIYTQIFRNESPATLQMAYRSLIISYTDIIWSLGASRSMFLPQLHLL